MKNEQIRGFESNGTKPTVAVPDQLSDLTDGNRVATNESNIQGLQGQVNTHNGEIANLSNEVANKASVQYVDQKFNGASKAISYDSYSTMITAFNALGDDVYAIGQDVLIQTLQVPDLWVSGIESASVQYTYVDDATFTSELNTNGYVQVGYYKLSALETQKVDLTDYQEKLTAGTNITIDANNVISASGGSNNAVTLDTTEQTFQGAKKLGLSKHNQFLTFGITGTNSNVGIGTRRDSGTLDDVGVFRAYNQNNNNSYTDFSDKYIRIQTPYSRVSLNLPDYPNNTGNISKTLATTDDILDKVPNAPTTDGTYVLKCVVSNGTPTYQWVLES